MHKSVLGLLLLILLSGCAVFDRKTPKDYVFSSRKGKTAFIASYNKSLQLWEIPYKEEDIPTTLGTAHVIISGPSSGKPVVLLHGMDATSTMWYPNIKALSKNHRVYAIDFLKEVGKSKLTEKTLSKEEIVAWYNQIFDHYKLKDFDLIGASKGGWLATLLAVQKENEIGKLVLLSPAQAFQNIEKAGKASAALMLKAFPSRKKLDKTLAAFSYYPEKIHPDYKQQFLLANKYARTSSSFLQMQPFSDEELKQINFPVLVLVGDHDIINSEETLNKAKETIAKSQVKIIQNAGHFLSIDQSDEVNRLMVDFLKQ